ncbi:CCR4-NOT core subunit CAF130 Ecym_1232 [Eremothecium cymbalariae DBVPG|uniref:Uncharacterized protein n=1 Tax=Eremothecium cymbalariae (strain CBS 270.75 / DBVPG 7215 / KCTC 17166 / NRRL Y-17582) TaxID=931890 RepID=G8JN14_ERECY|nr:hypothetical protein Ecym_1232 [Eremothecium cymbalariae DBVPG\
MVRKNKTKVDAPVVKGPLTSIFRTYKPDIRSLVEFRLNVGDEHFDALITEKVVVTLFMTRSGNSMLHMLYDLCCGRIKLTEYKQSLKVRSNHSYWKSCYKDWGSRRDILSEFLDFCLRNENCALDYIEYASATRKLPLQFLLPEPLRPYLIDDEYNLLLDYMIQSRPMWEMLLTQGIPKFLPELVDEYNRSYEFNGYYVWYGNVTCSQVQVQSSTKELYTKFFYTLFDKLTVTKELLPKLNVALWSHSWPASYTKQTLLDLSNDDDDHYDQDVDSENDHWPQQKLSSREQVFTFDLNRDGTLEFPNVFLHAKKRHEILYRVLGLPDAEGPLLKAQFMTLAALVDPITQPPPTEDHIISIDLIFQMFLGSTSNLIENMLISRGRDWRFHVCYNMQKIVLATMKRLNCHDGDVLNTVNNSDESVHWNVNLDKWTPRGLNTQDLELLYMVDMLSIYAMYRLYSYLPVQMNPFLPLALHLWKNLTNVLLRGLEIDRFEEDRETFNTPIIVRAAIRGTAALRSVVATMINDHFSSKEHDFKHEPINLFMSPHGRKLCHGALYADVRSHAAAMLSLGIDLNDVTDLLSDLQPGDRFDDDVKYMFDYEYDDYNAIDPEQLYDENEEDLERLEEIQQRERIKDMRGYYKRCHCVFDDDELLSDEEEGETASSNIDRPKYSHNSLNLPSSMLSTTFNGPNSQKFAIRSRDGVDFDFNGKDWRDIPRGLNFYYTEHYVFVNKLHADVVYYLMKEATTKKMEPNHASFILRSIATCIKLEQEKSMVYDVMNGRTDKGSSSNSNSDRVNELTSDFIYEKWCEESLFTKMMYYNNDLVWRMMDEMLMCSGYRRVLIWFITHLEISHSLIHYIFELVMGMRGNVDYDEEAEDDIKNRNLDILDSLSLGSSSVTIKIPFSRQGPIILSIIEINMLLLEFFINATIYFSDNMKNLNSDEELPLSQSENEGSDDLEYGLCEDGDKDTLGVSPHVIGLMKLVCFMVDMLMEKKKFDFTDSEYIFELQTLLMNWIGIIPEARNLFFKLKSSILEASSQNDSSKSDKQGTENIRKKSSQSLVTEGEGIEQKIVNIDREDHLENCLSDADFPPTPIDINNLKLENVGSPEIDNNNNLSKYNKMLIELLPLHVDNENTAVTALRSFITKHSLTNKTAVFGRRVIYQDHAIMGLYMADKEMRQREFLAEFGIDYNSVVNNEDEELST